MNSRHRKILIVSASAVILFALAVGCLLWGRLFILEKIQARSDALRASLGAPVIFDEPSFHYLSVVLGNIRIGPHHDVVIREVVISPWISFSEWPPLAKVDAAIISPRLALESESLLFLLSSLSDKSGNHGSQKPQPENSDGLSSRVHQVTVHDGEVMMESAGREQPLFRLSRCRARFAFDEGSGQRGRVHCDDAEIGGSEVAGSIGIEIQRPDNRGLVATLNNQSADNQLLWSLAARVDEVKRRVELALDFKNALPSFLTNLVPSIDLSQTKGPHRIQIDAISNADGNVQLTFQAVAHDLLVMAKSLAPLPVGPRVTTVNATALVDFKRPGITFDDILVSFSNDQDIITDDPHTVVLHVKGVLERDSKSLWHSEFQIHFPKSICRNTLAALPQGLIPALKDFDLEGSIGFSLAVAADLSAPEDFTFKQLQVDGHCSVREPPRGFTREDVGGMFPAEVVAPGPRRPAKTIAEQRQGVARMFGRILPTAVVVSEDSAFWSHGGIDWHQLDQALRRNIRERKFKVGASTITMQTVKNLFFSKERTVGRKVQEAFLALYLEKSLTKEEILKVYLNIAEFGPGIFGITPAAKYYFNKSPKDLTTLESLFIASLLPAPVRRHQYFCRQRLTEGYRGLLRQLGSRLVDYGVLSQSGLEETLSQPLRFSDNPQRGAHCARQSSNDYDLTAPTGTDQDNDWDIDYEDRGKDSNPPSGSDALSIE